MNLVDVEQEFLLLALLVLFFQEDVADGVHNKNLAILGNDTLPLPNGGGGGLSGCGGARPTRGCPRTFSALLAVLFVHHPLLTTGHGNGTALVGIRSGSRGSGDRVDARDTTNTQLVTPSSPTSLTNVPIDELSLALPAQDQGPIVGSTTEDQKQAHQHRSQTGTEARVVVSGALPQREAILQEVIVALAAGATQDIGDEVQTSGAGGSSLDRGIDLALGRAGGDVDTLLGFGIVLVLGVVGDEGSLDLVRVQGTRLLAVGLCDLFLIGIRADLEEV